MTATSQHPATKPLLDFVEMIQAAGMDTTNVQYESDPNLPGRTAIRITGPTRVGVQAQIDKAMRSVEDGTGFANFIGPARVVGGWGAMGEIVIDPSQPAVSI